MCAVVYMMISTLVGIFLLSGRLAANQRDDNRDPDNH